MPREVIYSDEFSENVSLIESNDVLLRLDQQLELLEAFPTMGSSDVRPSLTAQFGHGLRKFPSPPHVIVYRYLEERDRLEFLALVPARRIR